MILYKKINIDNKEKSKLLIGFPLGDSPLFDHNIEEKGKNLSVFLIFLIFS